MRIFRISLISVVSILLVACAQVVAPTGGVKDIAPPEILDLVPANETTNFSSTEITISFDEYVKLVKLKDELIVSPPLKYALITKIKGKDIILEIKDTLKANTTYVFNFGNSIVDIRENNPLADFSYVFSTGTEIDTLSLSGRIISAFDAKVEKGVLMMLYEADADSIPLKELPVYVARTDKDGLYKIGNIKKGDYKAFALKDGNKNFLFDRADEKIAFDTNRIIVDSNLTGRNFYLFQEDKEKQFVKNQKEKGANVVFNFNRAFDTITFSGLDTNLAEITFVEQIGKNQDSVSIWFKEMDGIRTKLIVSDLLEYTDTITVKIDSARKKLKVSIDPSSDYFKSTSIKFDAPVKDIDTSKILVYAKDSSILKATLILDHDASKLKLNFTKEQDSTYFILILPGAFTSYYDKTNDTIQKKIRINSERDYGILQLNLNSSINEPKLIQLLNAKGDVLRQVKLIDSQVIFKNLNPGKYRLKCILDRNNNGDWDTGIYLEKLLPEKVILFEEEIPIRSNWDKEITWNIEL